MAVVSNENRFTINVDRLKRKEILEVGGYVNDQTDVKFFPEN